MSFFPSPVLVRLQELKLWQGNYDSLLQNKSREVTNPSDFETIEGLSALDSTRSSSCSSPERGKQVDWDKKAISPSKPFEELLEEKLAQDKPIQVQAKPKRPFLRKGSGLLRFKLSQQPVPVKSRTQNKPATEGNKKSKQVQNKNYSTTTFPKSCLKPNYIKDDETVDNCNLTPLKMPDLAIKPKATWKKVLEKDNVTCEENLKDQCNKLSSNFQIYQSSINPNPIGKMNDINLRHFFPLSPRRGMLNKNYSESINTIPEVEVESSPSIDDNFSHEKSTENELRLFETLEERVEHSSFSSTSSSILRLLSSTPNKVKHNLSPRRVTSEEQQVFDQETIPSGYHVQTFENILLQRKLQEVNKRTDVLNDFLRNLRKYGANNHKMKCASPVESVQERSPETTFSDEEKWSSNTEGEDRSRCPSTSYTDEDTTFRGSTTTKIDVAVNTSIEEPSENVKNKICENCEELREKLARVSQQLPNIQAEKAKVCDFAKELENKRDQLHREMEKMKMQYETAISDLRNEMEDEKKKFVREKLVFDMYLKDAQKRPTRKEREELSDLKKELADTKELLKLKESKNGATQARLRTQIKQFEKETSELKTEVEKLQKENAKLNATQLMRRPSEVKMLHEINRNLTKLTEETLKKQMFMTDMSCNTEKTEDLKKKRPKKTKEVQSTEREASSRVRRVSYMKDNASEDVNALSNISDDTCSHEMTTFTNLSLEKQYENVFGQFRSPKLINNNSLNDSKRDRTETVFEDGSKEVKYSNGNTKTISPDGTLIIVKYYNGDIKETDLTQNILKYFYAENGSWHITYGDGTEVLEYANGQTEKTYPDGKKEVKCIDGSYLIKNVDGTEEIVYPDGSKIIKKPDGEKILLLPNGQKEIHTKEHKRREYPDGTVKILYPDGTQETRYASGRIRIKDANGVLIMDSQNSLA